MQGFLIAVIIAVIIGGGIGLVGGFLLARSIGTRAWRHAFNDAIAIHEAQAHDLHVEVDQLRAELLDSEARAERLRIENDGLWRWKWSMDDLEEREQQESVEITAVVAAVREAPDRREGDEP